MDSKDVGANLDGCDYELAFITSERWVDARAAAVRALVKLSNTLAVYGVSPQGYMAYVCPVCGYAMSRSRADEIRRLGLWLEPFGPTCPIHYRVKMVEYVPELLDLQVWAGFRLLERLWNALTMKLVMLEAAAKKYAGRPPDEWRLYFPPAIEAAFDDDPTIFRYTWWRNAVEAYLHRLDQDRHREALDYLRRAAVGYFLLELCAEINRQHADAPPPGAAYDRKKGVYRIVERP
jgi:hypothetical protein